MFQVMVYEIMKHKILCKYYVSFPRVVQYFQRTVINENVMLFMISVLTAVPEVICQIIIYENHILFFIV